MNWLNGWGRDFRHGARSLARRPGFVSAAALTMALGIGANTAIFAIVNGIVLRPLPYDNAGRIVMVWEDLLREGNHRFSVSPPNYRDVRDQSTVFSDAAAQLGTGARLRVSDAPELVRAGAVTGNFFSVIGARAALGRVITPEDTMPDQRSVAVISHALWRHSFAADPAVIGRTVDIDGARITIVGVMPERFTSPIFFKAPNMLADLWLPLVLPREMEPRGFAALQIVARLKDGVTVEAAQQEVSGIAHRLAAAYPETNADVGLNVVSMQEQIIGDLRPSLLILLGAVAFLLLIACANLANLFLARALDRKRDVAIRLALGAGRSGIVRQFLAEAILVSAVGGALALAIGWAGMRVLLSFAPPGTVRLNEVRLDPMVLTFCIALTAFVTFVIALAPGRQATRVDTRSVLGSAGDRGSARSGRLRGSLVIGQIALAVVLLAGAGLMIRSLERLQRVDIGFPADHLLTMRFGMSEQRHPTPEQQSTFLGELFRKFETVPGVRSVAFSTRIPLDPAYGVSAISFAGKPVPAGERPNVGTRIVSDAYFRTMGIPIRDGRDFTKFDLPKSTPVVLVNAAFARHFWPGRNAIGQRIAIADPDTAWVQVVGIAGDVAHDGVGTEPVPEVYVPYAQLPQSGGVIVVRTNTDPASIENALRRAGRDADPDLAFIDMRPLTDMVDSSIAPRRFLLLLLASFAAVALLLSAVGVYGVVAYLVGQRKREMGIRAALGAQRSDLLLLVGGHGLRLAVIGAAIGLGGAFALTRLLAAQLYHVSPTDPATFAGATIALVLVAMLAVYVPAQRAAATDPALSLRGD